MKSLHIHKYHLPAKKRGSHKVKGHWGSFLRYSHKHTGKDDMCMKGHCSTSDIQLGLGQLCSVIGFSLMFKALLLRPCRSPGPHACTTPPPLPPGTDSLLSLLSGPGADSFLLP